jgi:hypothetical protein
VKPYNAGDPAQVRERSERIKSVEKLELTDFKAVLDTPEGRRVLWRLLTFCHIYESSFHPSSQIYFNEGVRSVGLKILADIQAVDPEKYLQMMRENYSKEE